jgi:transmembrane sensor
VNEDDKGCINGVDRWSEALAWYSTLRDAEKGDLTGAVGGRWQQWHSDAENQRVFDDVSRLLVCHYLYSKRDRQSKTELNNDRYDLSVPIAAWLRPRASRQIQKLSSSKTKWGRWSPAPVAAAAATVLFLLLSLCIWSTDDRSSPVVYQTAVGELENVHLNDGSSIILGGRTKVSVAFSTKRRSIRLIAGQGWFKVAHDPRRPFVVSAGDGKITDVGTDFLITRESDRVVVAVTEGTVEVSTRPSFWSRLRLERVRVHGGEQLTLGDNGTLSRVRPTDTHAAIAWTQGRLTFDDQPLRYVIETVSRYYSRPIFASAGAGSLRLSGIVFENDIQGWLQSLNGILPVTVQEQGNSMRIEMHYPLQVSVTSHLGPAGK